MTARDPHRFVNELDAAAVERLIARLESRAKDKVFTRLFDRYAPELVPGPAGRVLEVGCGTGATLRALAASPGFRGPCRRCRSKRRIHRRRAQIRGSESFADQVEFDVGDAHDLAFPDASFDIVFAHTLISHVTDPFSVLREMVRLVKPGGKLAIFDGDYASMTYALPDHDLGQRLDAALVKASFNNPRIMRDLPRMMPEFGLKLESAWGEAVVEIGSGSYFKSFVETYAPYIVKAGFFPAEVVEPWLAAQIKAIDDGTFFAACTYYTYIARRV
jgi:SAM-dependent methyltransferase